MLSRRKNEIFTMNVPIPNLQDFSESKNDLCNYNRIILINHIVMYFEIKQVLLSFKAFNFDMHFCNWITRARRITHVKVLNIFDCPPFLHWCCFEFPMTLIFVWLVVWCAIFKEFMNEEFRVWNTIISAQFKR